MTEWEVGDDSGKERSLGRDDLSAPLAELGGVRADAAVSGDGGARIPGRRLRVERRWPQPAQFSQADGRVTRAGGDRLGLHASTARQTGAVRPAAGRGDPRPPADVRE